ncbi:MAG: hypothetical protein ACI4UE_04215 [Candidatus Scatovivens sp.]
MNKIFVMLAGVHTHTHTHTHTHSISTRRNLITKTSTNFISAINGTIKKSYM